MGFFIVIAPQKRTYGKKVKRLTPKGKTANTAICMVGMLYEQLTLE